MKKIILFTLTVLLVSGCSVRQKVRDISPVQAQSATSSNCNTTSYQTTTVYSEPVYEAATVVYSEPAHSYSNYNESSNTIYLDDGCNSCGGSIIEGEVISRRIVEEDSTVNISCGCPSY